MIIEKVETYEVNGFKFKSKEDAEDFVQNHTLVYDDYEEGYVALSNKDIEQCKLEFVACKERLFEKYRKLANSNSMGALYPLAVISHVIGDSGVEEAWNEA